jgi:hypothetical protein
VGTQGKRQIEGLPFQAMDLGLLCSRRISGFRDARRCLS